VVGNKFGINFNKMRANKKKYRETYK